MSALLPVYALCRHRIDHDGGGVVTLVGVSGCPLNCRWCLNPEARDGAAAARLYTPEALYDALAVDDLYFQATNGGVTFGGGEPLMHADFLRAFIRLVNGRWRVRAETSLHVPSENAVLPLDEYIVDIKDMNPAIYHAYTGGNAALARENLAAVLRAGSADRVLARVPLIPDYNTEGDVQKSVEALRAMGVTRVDPFRFLRKEA